MKNTFRVPAEQKRAFLLKHKGLCRLAFSYSFRDTKAIKILADHAKEEGLYSQSTGSSDVVQSMRDMWEEICKIETYAEATTGKPTSIRIKSSVGFEELGCSEQFYKEHIEGKALQVIDWYKTFCIVLINGGKWGVMLTEMEGADDR